MSFPGAEHALLVLSYSLTSTARTDFILHQAPQMTLFSQPHKYLRDKLEKFQRKIPLYVTTKTTVYSGFHKITFIATFLRILENPRVKLCSSSRSCHLYHEVQASQLGRGPPNASCSQKGQTTDFKTSELNHKTY